MSFQVTVDGVYDPKTEVALAAGNPKGSKLVPGGRYNFKATGNFDGGTITLQSANDGTDLVAVSSETTLSADGQGNCELPSSDTVAIDANGLGGSADIQVALTRIDD